MQDETIKMVCPCLLGLEGPVAAELRAMEAQNVQAQNGKVYFEGKLDMLARANLCIRFGERVLVELGAFPARSFEELFEGVRALPWERWIGRDNAFPVKGHSLNSKLHSVPDCQSIIKKAVVERLKSKYRVSWFQETGSLRQIQFLILKDQVSVMLDASGVGLHKRGYRAHSTEAPIKETLAAAMAYFARVRPDATFYDPFCGSGTILIEAALYAMRIAPGLGRRFAAERWEEVPAEIWRAERARAQDSICRDVVFAAQGYDNDSAAVALTLENAKKAGVDARVKADVRDIRRFDAGTEYGCVVCNPPYGERLLDVSGAQALYRQMGERFVPKRDWSYTVISPDPEFERCFGRPADKRRKLYNGMLACQLYQFFKV